MAGSDVTLGMASVMARALGISGIDLEAMERAYGLGSKASVATNGFDARSPGGYSAAAAFLCEVTLTAFFVIVIMGVTGRKAPKGFAAIAIGLALTLIHLISIPVTNTSVNPARSTGPALIVGGAALQQLWLFWLAPVLGGVLGALAYRVTVKE